MKQLKKIILVLLVVFSCGCGQLSQWWDNFRQDPIAGLTTGVGYLSNAVSLAETAFNMYTAANPGVDPTVKSQFNTIVATIRSGISTAQGALNTAAQLHQPQPDTDQLLASARTTTLSLADFLRRLPHPNGSAVDPSMARAIEACQNAGSARTPH